MVVSIKVVAYFPVFKKKPRMREGEVVFLPKKRQPPDIDDSQVGGSGCDGHPVDGGGGGGGGGSGGDSDLDEGGGGSGLGGGGDGGLGDAAAAAAVTKIAVATAAKVAAAAAVNSIAVAVAAAASTLGIRKDTRAHALGVSTLLQTAPSLYSTVRPALPLRPPARCATVTDRRRHCQGRGRCRRHRSPSSPRPRSLPLPPSPIAVAAAAKTAAAAAVMTAVAAAAKAAAAAAVILTATPSLGNRKDTRAHAPGVSTLLQTAPSLYFSVGPAARLRLPTRCTRSGHHRGEHQQTCLSTLQLLQLSMSSMQEHCNDTRVSCPGREHPLPGQLAISSAHPSVSMQPPSRPDRSAHRCCW